MGVYIYGTINQLSLIKLPPLRCNSPGELLWLLSLNSKGTVHKHLTKHSGQMIKNDSTPRKQTDGGFL